MGMSGSGGVRVGGGVRRALPPVARGGLFGFSALLARSRPSIPPIRPAEPGEIIRLGGFLLPGLIGRAGVADWAGRWSARESNPLWGSLASVCLLLLQKDYPVVRPVW